MKISIDRASIIDQIVTEEVKTVITPIIPIETGILVGKIVTMVVQMATIANQRGFISVIPIILPLESAPQEENKIGVSKNV